ncbi:MAG: hypothetical protein H8E48_06665 [Chloroflexi bacterium]|nr:hypothetical protein [Chloroflexota bacterium]
MISVSDLNIVIPSLSRVDIIEKHPLREVASLCVPERQADAYQARYPDMKVWAHPDSVSNIAQARNYILDNCRRPEDQSLIMFDDDLRFCIYTMTLHPKKHLELQYMMEVLEQTQNMAIDAGAGVFGFAHTPNPRERNTFVPFTLRGWVNCRSIGIIDPELRFDDNLHAKEDFDICLQSLQKHRIVWCEMRWVFVCEHWSTQGGLQEVRTTATQKFDEDYLIEKWGTKVMRAGGKTRKTGMSLSVGVS